MPLIAQQLKAYRHKRLAVVGAMRRATAAWSITSVTSVAAAVAVEEPTQMRTAVIDQPRLDLNGHANRSIFEDIFRRRYGTTLQVFNKIIRPTWLRCLFRHAFLAALVGTVSYRKRGKADFVVRYNAQFTQPPGLQDTPLESFFHTQTLYVALQPEKMLKSSFLFIGILLPQFVNLLGVDILRLNRPFNKDLA